MIPSLDMSPQLLTLLHISRSTLDYPSSPLRFRHWFHGQSLYILGNVWRPWPQSGIMKLEYRAIEDQRPAQEQA